MDHALHIDGIESEGWARWRFTCEHQPDDERWFCRDESGNIIQSDRDVCWFQSWWEGVGSELLGSIPGPITFPLAVKPSADWVYDDGGTIVRDVG